MPLLVMMLLKLPVAPVNVPLICASPLDLKAPNAPVPPEVTDAAVTFPLPSTEKGYVVPLKTLKPPPLVARTPDALATTPVAVTEVEFTEPALTFVACRS